MEEYMNIALEQALKAFKNDDVPIGAIIVKKGKIIAKAYNKKEKNGIATQHAEILAINKACRKLKNWRLLDCTIYTTVEPCLMCYGAIIQARIKTVVYGSKNDNFGYSTRVNNTNINNKETIEIIGGICENKSKMLIQKFFKEKRK
ncbi:MAG: nucleoside deaminase [Bacilli bacterium]